MNSRTLANYLEFISKWCFNINELYIYQSVSQENMERDDFAWVYDFDIKFPKLLKLSYKGDLNFIQPFLETWGPTSLSIEVYPDQ